MTDADRNRRREPRIDVQLEVDYTSGDTFLFAKALDISTMGIFIATPEPQPIGTKIRLRFTPQTMEIELGADGAPGAARSRTPIAPLQLEGVVVWAADGDSGRPGMGIQFRDMDARSRTCLMNYVQAIAYLGGS